ncbi:hypothetical protein LTR15_005930 [Elasticomyces elasticus]|nr:hypothetical protein LTR15_005930 [Elasticomyces elasticus]
MYENLNLHGGASEQLDGQLTMSNVNYNFGLFHGSGSETRQLACFTLVHLDDWRPLDGRNLDLTAWNTLTRAQNSIRRTIGKVVAQGATCPTLCVQIQAWLNKCSRHALCPHNYEVPFPDRVLQLDSPAAFHVRLIEQPHDLHIGRYVALSYCWGHRGQYLLTDATCRTLKAGLEVSRLPQTIRDAIVVTKTLGYAYLWIDALTIRQDSAMDWEQQSSKMAAIYGKADLTLLASNAAGVDEGFLRARASSETYCGYHVYNGRKKPLYLAHAFPGFDGYAAYGDRVDPGLDDVSDWRRELDHNETSMPFVVHEPLTSRGWSAQERGLSARKVYFGSKQMFWECRTCLLFENGYTVRDRSQTEIRDEQLWSPIRWARAVEVYSGCKLTRITDRLPAISGTAGEFASNTQDEYIAGHFARGIMLSSLIWEPTVPRPSTSKHEFLAPSWSWASQEYAIQYPHVEGKLWSFETVGKVLAHDVVAKGQNPFGQVTEGWLEVLAPALHTTVGRLPEKHFEDSDGSTRTVKDHARRTVKFPDMALEFVMKAGCAESSDDTSDVAVASSFTLDYIDLPTNVPAIFVVLSKRTNATRRRDLQRFQPEGSFVSRSTFGGIIVSPVQGTSQVRTFRRIGAFYDMTALLPMESQLSTMRLV